MSSQRSVALVLAADDSRRRAWAISSAVAMARRLARGRKVLLADLECRTPSALAATLGEAEETPGIVDVLFRGASFPSVARRPTSQPLIFLPCGCDPPPLAEVYRHPGWAKIVRRLRGKNAVFLACVSADDWAELGPIPGFEACIVFNGTGGEVHLPAEAQKIAEVEAPSESPSEHGVESGFPGLAVPAAAEVAAEPAPGLPGHTPEAKELDEAEQSFGVRPAEPPESGVDHRTQTPTGARLLAALRTLGDDFEHALGRRRKRVAYAALVAVTSFALAATVWLVSAGVGCSDQVNARRAGLADGDEASGWSEVASCVLTEARSLLWRSETGSEYSAVITLERTDPSAGGTDGRGASGVGNPACEDAADETSVGSGLADGGCAAESHRPGAELSLPYAVVVEEFTTLDAARRRLKEYEGIPVPFYVVPTQAEEAVRYRVYAGLLADRLQAEELLSRLVYSGIKDGLAESDIRHVRYAFSFGIFRLEAEARSVLATLQAHDVPAYLVRAPGGGGQGPAYRVYAGAFESPAESLPLRDSIRRTGIRVELVERTGLAPR